MAKKPTIIDYGDLSWVKSGKRRRAVLRFMADGIYTPSEIGEATVMGTSAASYVLQEFEERKIVQCMTPEERIGRLYQLTRKGHNLYNNL